MVVPDWVDRLGGADVFTDENAFAMAEACASTSGISGPSAYARERAWGRDLNAG